MGTLGDRLADRVRAALERAGYGGGSVPCGVSVASDARFGDYQSNVAMVLGKRLGTRPHEIARRLVEAFDPGDLVEAPTVAGPGFLNFRLTGAAIEGALGRMLVDPRRGVGRVEAPRRVLIDFSSPNIAKPMHVGHIRSTILGDALARVARFLGHEVITDNHLGDWGTQFGKVIHGWKHLRDDAALGRDPVGELVRLYREVNRMAEAEPAVEEASRGELVKLQGGDPENVAIWRRCVELSMGEFAEMYGRLGVRFDHALGESHYNDRLGPLVEGLLARGIAGESDGAICVFFPEHEALRETPCLIRKRDGGFLYATTDLATLEYRRERFGVEAIWYVVGAPQKLHLEQVFEVARRMGIGIELVHVAFGSILGEDRKMMKTRAGQNVGLRELLEEAEERALAQVSGRNPDLGEAERVAVARAIGIGAVKYADLSQHRLTDYVFSWDRMLSLQGNTAPYLQNAYVRIRSIFRRLVGGYEPGGAIVLGEDAERVLGMKLSLYPEVVPLVLDGFRPNVLTGYLYELANTFHSFYEACPVLKAEGETGRSRLSLCHLTGEVLRQGLDLLGIDVPERM